MNREIIFRGKPISDKYGEDFVFGDLIQITGGRKFIVNNKFGACIDAKGNFINTEAPFVIEVKPETVGQYTGLTDENGKRIFEGDIIRYADLYDYNCHLESIDNPEAYGGIDMGNIWTIDEVVYGINVGYPAFDLNRNDFEANGLCVLKESCQYFYEVIGNIYDNPELLEAYND